MADTVASSLEPVASGGTRRTSGRKRRSSRNPAVAALDWLVRILGTITLVAGALSACVNELEKLASSRTVIAIVATLADASSYVVDRVMCARAGTCDGVGASAPTGTATPGQAAPSLFVYYERAASGGLTSAGQLVVVPGRQVPDIGLVKPGTVLQAASSIYVRTAAQPGARIEATVPSGTCLRVRGLARELTPAQRGSASSGGWLEVERALCPT